MMANTVTYVNTPPYTYSPPPVTYGNLNDLLNYPPLNAGLNTSSSNYPYTEDVKKNYLEEIINEIFTPAEKLDFLINLGYELDTSTGSKVCKVPYRPNDEDQGKVLGVYSISDAFLREITIKFKNLLLAKALLKLKI